jgi:hypothetical protein
LLVYDFPVVIFVRIVREERLDVFSQPAKVGVFRPLDVRDVPVRDSDVEVVGLCLVIHFEVFDNEGKLFNQRLRICSGGTCNQQHKDSSQGARFYHRVFSFFENELAADEREFTRIIHG